MQISAVAFPRVCKRRSSEATSFQEIETCRARSNLNANDCVPVCLAEWVWPYQIGVGHVRAGLAVSGGAGGVWY